MENVIMTADAMELECMLGSMLTDQTYTDITFTFPEEAQKSVGAHKNILAMSSPVFREMFFGTRKIESDMIAISDIKYDTFMKMLMVFYYQKIEILSAEEAANLYYAGQKYKSKDTIDLVDSYATQTCNKETAQLYYRCARIFGNPELEQLCLRAYHQDILKSIQYINKFGVPDNLTVEADKTGLLKFGIDTVKPESKLYQEMEAEVEKIRDNNNLNSRVEQALGIIVYLNSKVKQIISLIVPAPNQTN